MRLARIPWADRARASPTMAAGPCMSEEDPSSDFERLRRERDLYLRLLGLASSDELEVLLEQALALVVEVTAATQGYLELRDSQSGSDEAFSMASGCSEPELRDIRGNLSRGIIAEAMATGETVVTQSALLDERFSSRASVQAGRIESVLCAPVGDRGALGVVYLQGRQAPGPFSEEDRRTAEMLALHLAPLADRLLMRRRAACERDATRALRERYALDCVVGHGRAIAEALEQAMLAAPLDVTVLLTGASGTGKTQIAHVIHANSTRAAGPLLEINCASLPESLIESELFGAIAGSHSEAKRDLPGKVRAAEGGTLFLDEIGELPMPSQAKLLQLLQSKQYFPLGSAQPVPADVRLIAASNSDLEQLVADRRFREDLFYRLNVLPVRLPALKERPEDIASLAQTLCERAIRQHHLGAMRLSRGAIRTLETSEWPGNVRQLENCLEAAAIRAAGERSDEIAPRHLFPERAAGPEAASAPATFQDATRAFHRELLTRTLDETGWNVSEAARRLDLARSYVYELIRAFGLERASSRARTGGRG